MNVDDLSFLVKISPNRKTMQITVERDGSLVLTLPPEATEQQAQRFIEEKRRWIYQKLAEKQQLHSEARKKAFVDGEGFLYLGRSYRLKLIDGGDTHSALTLKQGRFFLNLQQAEADSGRKAFIQWYTHHGQLWLSRKAKEYYRRMEVEPAGIRVKALGFRWGSCTNEGWLNFHWKTILLPAKMAEYIVVHELAHLHEPHHTPEFWQRVERVLPDYLERKQWIAEHGMEIEGL